MTPSLLPEIYLHIATKLRENEDLATLASLSSASKGMYDLLSPTLYKELTITRANAPAIFWGILPHAYEGDPKALGNKESSIQKEVRGQWSLWPDIALGEDDREDEDGDMVKSKLRALRDDEIHPDANTNSRKLHALSHVEELTIDSLPSIETSEALLKGFYPVKPTQNHIPLFPNIQKVHLSGKFVYELSNWFNLNLVTPRKENICDHPFKNFILRSIIPKPPTPPESNQAQDRKYNLEEFKIDYPTFTNHMKERFMNKRFGTKDVLLRCGVSEGARKEKLNSEWITYKERCISFPLIPFIWNWSSKVLIIDNVNQSYVPPMKDDSIRIIFRTTYDRSQDEEENQRATFERRIVQIQGILQPPIEYLKVAAKNVSSWEFVGAELGEGKEVETKIREDCKEIDAGRLVFKPYTT